LQNAEPNTSLSEQITKQLGRGVADYVEEQETPLNQWKLYNYLTFYISHNIEHILQNKRAEYRKQIVATLSPQLTEKYGNSFNEKNLRRMMQFADVFEDF